MWLETAGTWLRMAELNQNATQLPPTPYVSQRRSFDSQL